LAAKFKRILFSDSALATIKHVSFALCSRSEIPLNMTHSDWEDLENSDPGLYDNLDPTARMEQAHWTANHWLLIERTKIWDNLRQFSRLQTVEMDLKNAYCPVGCCRELTLAWSDLAAIKPKEVRILGLRNEGEREKLLKEWSDHENITPLELQEKYGVEILKS
jgi:hypothetical protein